MIETSSFFFVLKIVDCSNQNVTLRNVRNTDSKDDIGVERAELLSSWLVHTQEAVEVHTTNQPSDFVSDTREPTNQPTSRLCNIPS